MAVCRAQVPLVKTPNNGLHVFFKQPNGEALGNGRGSPPRPVCDVRGQGGFVIAPGARLPDAVVGCIWYPGVPQSRTRRHCRTGLSILRPPQHEEACERNNNETSDERGRAYAVAALNGLRPSSPRHRLASVTRASTRLASASALWPPAAPRARRMVSAGGWYRFANTHPHSGNCVNCGNCRTNEFPHIPQFLLIERGLRKDADRMRSDKCPSGLPSMFGPAPPTAKPPKPGTWIAGRCRTPRLASGDRLSRTRVFPAPKAETSALAPID